MKKKLISLFLVGAMTAGMVAGCGNSGNGSNAAAGNDSAAGDVASTENPPFCQSCPGFMSGTV